jgi:hypothetical protein
MSLRKAGRGPFGGGRINEGVGVHFPNTRPVTLPKWLRGFRARIRCYIFREPALGVENVGVGKVACVTGGGVGANGDVCLFIRNNVSLRSPSSL